MPCAVLGEAAGRRGAPRLPPRRLVPRALSMWPVFVVPAAAKGGTGTVLRQEGAGMAGEGNGLGQAPPWGAL